jgi:hypothetical protein
MGPLLGLKPQGCPSSGQVKNTWEVYFYFPQKKTYLLEQVTLNVTISPVLTRHVTALSVFPNRGILERLWTAKCQMDLKLRLLNEYQHR